MSSESEQLSVLAHTNDAFIRTDKQTDFESQSDLLCILSDDFLYGTILNSLTTLTFLPPRFSWKQLNEKVSQTEGEKYFVEAAVAPST